MAGLTWQPLFPYRGRAASWTGEVGEVDDVDGVDGMDKTEDERGPEPPRADGGRRWWSRAWPLAVLLFIAVSYATVARLPVDRVERAIEFPYQLDGEEGFLLAQAMRLAHGQGLYGSLDHPPYVVDNYPPLYPMVWSVWLRLAGRDAVPSLAAGRVIAASAAGIAALLVAALVAGGTLTGESGAVLRPVRGCLSEDERLGAHAGPVTGGTEPPSSCERMAAANGMTNRARAGGPRHLSAEPSAQETESRAPDTASPYWWCTAVAGLLAWACAVQFLTEYGAVRWMAYARVDLPAVALSLAGLALFAWQGRRTDAAGARACVAAALLMALGLLTKQTMLAAPAACVLWLLAGRRWRDAVRMAAWLALAVGIPTLLLIVATRGGYWRHTVAYNRNVMHWNELVTVWAPHLWRFHAPGIVAAALLFVWATARIVVGRRAERRHKVGQASCLSCSTLERSGNETGRMPVLLSDASETGKMPVLLSDGSATGKMPVLLSDGSETGRMPVLLSDGSDTGETPVLLSDGSDTGETPVLLSDGSETGKMPVLLSDGSEPVLCLLAIYAALNVLSLAAIAKAGSAENYLIEPAAATIAFVGVAMGRLVTANAGTSLGGRPKTHHRIVAQPPSAVNTSETGRGVVEGFTAEGGCAAFSRDAVSGPQETPHRARRLARAAFVAVVAALLAAQAVRYTSAGSARLAQAFPFNARLAAASGAAPAAEALVQGDRVVRWLRGLPDGPVLCEDPIYLLRAGRPVYFQNFIMTQLAAEGKWDETPVAQAAAEGRIVGVMSHQDLLHAKPDEFSDRWSPALREAIRKSYRLTAQFPSPSRMPPTFIYEPSAPTASTQE
jgi:hypothetical protein